VDYISETPNESIEKDKLSAKEAFNKFSDKSFDTRTEDYSSSLVKKRLKKGGFLRNQTEYEMQPELREETPSQKFHRLQYDVKNFLEELEKKKLEKTEEKAEEVDTTGLTEELVQLQKLLQATLSDEKAQLIVNPKQLEMGTNLQEGISKKLLAELQGYVNKPQPAAQAQKAPQSVGGAIVYELYYTPEQAKTAQASKLADLEKRLTQFEQIVGNKQSGIPTLDLISTVDSLKEKFHVLTSTPAQLEALQRTVKTISQDLDKIVEQKQKPEGDALQKAHEQKINELFELMSKWDVVSEQVPALASRLQSLRSLHEDAASFQKSILSLETQQDDIKKLLKFNSDLMHQVDTNFKGNLNVIQTNVTTLEKKFSDLHKRLEELGMETF